MTLRWNAKADTVSTLVLWLGSLVAAVICIVWLTRNLSPEHVTVQQIDNELTTLQRDMNTACRMDTYWKNYYPKLAQGTMLINELQICFDSSICKVVFYRSNETEPIYGDNMIILNNSYSCPSIEKCRSYYYSGPHPPEFLSDFIVLMNATSCKNKRPPIQKCRLLMCWVNASHYVDLNEVIYVNITKDENDTFNFETH